MLKRQLRLFYLICLVFSVVLIHPAYGSEAESPMKKGLKRNRSNQAVLEPITVTAQKRKEDIQKIPMSISAFSDIQIEDADIGNVQELTLLTPNVHMKKGASTNMLIFRGISNDADFIHAPASLYVDDICFSMNFMHNPDLFDIERIEVLRGPQGTLYGRNSESGVINIVTRQPDNDVTGKIFGEIAAYDPDHGSSMSYRTGLSLSGPLKKDTLYMGFAGQIETSDGFIKNSSTGSDDAGEIDHQNARLTTRWTPSNKLEISAILDILDTDDGNGNKRYDEGPWKTSPHEINYNNDRNVNEQKGNGQNIKVKYEGDHFNLLSITGRRFYENNMLRDSKCSPVDDGINDLTYSSDMISEELRITSPEAQGVFKWVGGIYMFEEENETDIDLPAWKEIRNTDMETRGYALFGEGTLTVFKRLHLTAGLRYSYEDMDGDMEGEIINGDLLFSESFDNDVLLPKFAVSYELLPQLLTYATVSRGYYSGGFNSAAAVSPETFTYDPEYTWNHEIGIKSSWFNNRLNFNVALFYIAIDDKQVAQLDGVTDARDIQNAAEAHSQGFEMELHAKPMPGTDIFAGIGYTDVVFDRWVAREQISPPGKPKQYAEYDYSDKQFPNAPEFTGNLGFQYRHKSGFYGRTDLIWSDNFYSDAKNTQKVEGRTLVNLRTGYEGENYDIILWCKNLLNEEYQTMGFARKFDQHVDGEPRMFGVTLTYHF